MQETGSIANKPDFKRAEKEALALLENFGYEKPPINPVDIAEAMGIRVRFVELKGEDDKISGFYYAKEDAIYVNRKEFSLRQTFTIAHELGHKVLHKDWLESSSYQVLLRDQTANPKDDPKEQEANAFAANLLVPKFMLDKYAPIASIPELSTLFMVSKPVIQSILKRTKWLYAA